jgi:hypothetical protein
MNKRIAPQDGIRSGRTGSDARDADGILFGPDEAVTFLFDAEPAGASDMGPASGPVSALTVAGPPVSTAPPKSVRTIVPTSSVGTTGNFVNQDINGLLSGVAWNASTITYSFPTSITNYGAAYPNPDGLNGFQILTAAQREVARYAFGLISQYTGLAFSEMVETDSDHAMIRFAGSSDPETSYSDSPGTGDTNADVFFGNIRNDTPTRGGYAFETIMHEIGHAMGLKHGFEDNATFGTTPAIHASTSWSIMEYSSYIGGPRSYTNVGGSGPQTYMSGDISVLQYMYGANFNTNSAGTIYTWNVLTGEEFVNGVGQGASSANRIYGSIWDGGGIDWYDLSNYTTNLTINLNPGEWSTFSSDQLADLDNQHTAVQPPPGNILNANLHNNDNRSLIENATGGSGNDVLTGNVADNFLIGGLGNDTIAGGAGNNDTAWFSGQGSDYIVIYQGGSIYTVTGADGTDKLIGIEKVMFGLSPAIPIAATPDDYAATIATIGTLSPGSTIKAGISAKSDRDWFSTKLTAGATYWISVEGSSSKQGTLLNPGVQLIGADGVTVVASDDDGGIGTDAFLQYTPNVTATYYVEARSSTGGVGIYRVGEAIADDAAPNPATTRNLTAGIAVNATIGASADRDWFRVSLTAGKTYWFSADGAGSGKGTLSDPFLRVLGSGSGGVIELVTDDDSGIGFDAFASYTPTTSGTYYVEVGGAGGNTGTYQVGWALADDLPANPTTTATLSIGSPKAGTINFAGDRDWIATTLTAGVTYWFDMYPNGGVGLGPVPDPYLRLLGGDGTVLLASNNDSGVGLNPFLSYTASKSGTYFLSAQGVGAGIGGYIITQDLADDAPGSPGTTRTLNPGNSVNAEITFKSDVDWFRTTLTAGVTYWFSAEGVSTEKGTLVSPRLRIYDAEGQSELAHDVGNGVGENAFLSFVPNASGLYHVSMAGAGPGTGTYRVSAIVADDYASVPVTEGDLGGSVDAPDLMFATGTIEHIGDTDWFRTFLQGGKTYWFSLEGSATGKGTLADPYLRLFNEAGTSVVAFNDDSGAGSNAFLTYTPGTSGHYNVSAQGFGSSGTYQLTRAKADDVAGNPSTSRTMTTNGSGHGKIDYAGDTDWFRINLTAGTEYWISMQGSGSGAGTLVDPVLRLLNAEGTVALALDDDSGVGTDPFLTFKPAVTATYYLAAEGYGSTTGTYQLRTMVADDYPATPATGAEMSAGAIAPGMIGVAGDVDWFSAELVGGVAYVINLQGNDSSKGTLANPHLQLFGDDGATLVGADADSGHGLDARLTFTPVETNIYHIAASGSAGSVGSYMLTLAFSRISGPPALSFIGSTQAAAPAEVADDVPVAGVGWADAVVAPSDLLPVVRSAGGELAPVPMSAMSVGADGPLDPSVSAWGMVTTERWT